MSRSAAGGRRLSTAAGGGALRQEERRRAGTGGAPGPVSGIEDQPSGTAAGGGALRRAGHRRPGTGGAPGPWSGTEDRPSGTTAGGGARLRPELVELRSGVALPRRGTDGAGRRLLLAAAAGHHHTGTGGRRPGVPRRLRLETATRSHLTENRRDLVGPAAGPGTGRLTGEPGREVLLRDPIAGMRDGGQVLSAAGRAGEWDI